MVETVRCMRRPRRWAARSVAPTLAILGALLAPAAFAEPEDSVPSSQPLSFSPEPGRSQTLPNGWWRDHFALRLRGLEFREDFEFRKQNLQFRLVGPVVKGNPGMRLEVRGWTWGQAVGTFSAYGSAERQGFKLRVDF